MKTEELDNLNLSVLLRIERDLFNCIHQTLIDIVQQKIGLSSFAEIDLTWSKVNRHRWNRQHGNTVTDVQNGALDFYVL